MIEIPLPSPNFSSRKGAAITAIIIHRTAGSLEGAKAWLTSPESQVSAHVLIARDGGVFRLVNDEMKAWHAGVSSLHGVDNVNTFSLGVELDARPGDSYTFHQMNSLVTWCAEKSREYQVPLNRIVGHQHVSPGRKIDPGPEFDWVIFLRRCAQNVVSVA